MSGRASGARPASTRPRTARTAAVTTTHSAPVGVEQAPAVPGPHQPAVEGAEPADVEEQPGAHRRVQPVGERDRGVLRPALLGDQRVPLDQREALGLLLQVVEEVQQPFFPAHA